MASDIIARALANKALEKAEGGVGEPAGFAEPTIKITSLPTDAEPEATITATGPDTAKKFAFDFKLPRGPKGDTGETGLQGPRGETGATGSQGPAGPAGPEGPIGKQGQTGPAGPAGAQGIQGNPGIQGPKGNDGHTPEKGVDYFTQSEIESIENNAAGKVKVPTQLSELTEDAEHHTVTDIEKQTWSNKQEPGNYLLDNEISEWAKQANKPTYTAEEIGALPSGTKIPAKTSELQNDSGFLTVPFGIEVEGEDSHELKPNIYCSFARNHSNINVTILPSEEYAEYMFGFATSPSGCNLAIPDWIKWDGDLVPTIEPNKRYQVSIFGGIAIMSKGVAI